MVGKTGGTSMSEYYSGGIKLYYEEAGEGLPVLLIHGYPLMHTIWKPVINLLGSEARWITPDIRGFGRSSSPKGTYSMPLLASDMAALLDHLQIKSAVVIGHSMGGYIALNFFKAYPERLLGLGLICSQAAADNEERRAARQAQIKKVIEQGTDYLAATMAATLTNQTDLVTDLQEIILQADTDGIIGALLGMAEREDMTDYLSKIKVPTLVVVGSSDTLIPTQKSREMANRLPDASLVQIANAAHIPMMENPRALAYELSNWLKKIPWQKD
jgi:3-oxoadipate enol-lactonase